MSNNDNSFESEGFSNCEEDEIVTKDRTNSKVKDEPEEVDDPTKLPNYKLIKAISLTLDNILENNKLNQNYKEKVKRQSKMVFSANLIPNISIEDYLLRIQTYSNIEKSTLIISLIFIDKLCNTADITLTYYNIHRILFTAVLISIKYNEDSFFDNKYYSEIAGVKIKELKLLEYTFISMVDFKFFVSTDLYQNYLKYLEDFAQ